MDAYRHTQSGTVVRWCMVSGFLVVPALIRWSRPAALPLALLAGLAGMGALLAFLFWSLTLEIQEASFAFWFGPGLLRKKVPLDRIVACTPVEGLLSWGIHWTGRAGWLYNVSGRKAVAVTLADGSGFLVGTDEPEAVCAAVHRYQKKK